MKSILITGGTGFIGSHTCVVLLEKNFNLIVIDSNVNSSEKSLLKIKNILKDKLINFDERLLFMKGDLRDEDFLRNVFSKAKEINKEIFAVIHFAGLKAAGESVKNPLLYWDFNLVGSLCLFKIMQENKCNNIVFSSSATIYGFSDEKLLIESSQIKPNNPYGNTKAAIEVLLDDIFKSTDKTWRIANLRYFNPIGAHCSGLIGEDPNDKPNNLFPYLCNVAIQNYPFLNIYGNDWPTIDGTGVRDYIHVMDLADAHYLALNYLLCNSPQRINLNIGTGKGTSVLELVNIFSNVNNCEIPFVIKERRNGDVPTIIADNRLALSTLNWRPFRSLEEMCKDGWNWIKNNPKGY